MPWQFQQDNSVLMKFIEPYKKGLEIELALISNKNKKILVTEQILFSELI